MAEPRAAGSLRHPEQQDRKARPATLGPQKTPLGQHLENDRRRRQRQDYPPGDRGVPRKAKREADGRQQGHGKHDLQTAQPDQPVAQTPERARLHLQPDQEQHEHNSVLGILLHMYGFRSDQAERGPDRHASDQIAEHRSKPQPLAQRHEEKGRSQIDRQLQQDRLHGVTGLHRPVAPFSASRATTAICPALRKCHSLRERTRNTIFPFARWPASFAR